MKLRDKIIASLVSIIVCVVFIIVVVNLVFPLNAKADENGLIKVSSTAYYDSHGYGYGATGQPLVEGLTVAGKKEWIGMTCALYDMDMNFLGYFEFRDTGYGQSTGKGNSKILKGRSIGTIENGTCIDIYFDTYAACKAWGRRTVYMKLIKAVG